ncbi:MAG: hypothetical protein R3Y54_05925 [Eubacteriales bacterium]
MSNGQLYAQRSQKESELGVVNNQLLQVEEKLEQVARAKAKIAILKESAKIIEYALKELDYEYAYNWYGNRQSHYAYDKYNPTYQEAKRYYELLDELADELVDTERRLNSEKEQYNFLMKQLQDAIAWIIGEIEKAFN